MPNQVAPAVFTPKAESLATLNPLLIRQHLEQRIASDARTEQMFHAQHPPGLYSKHDEHKQREEKQSIPEEITV